jgi:hypothetical protein
MRPRGSLIRTLAITSMMNLIRLIAWAAFRVATLLSRHTFKQPSRRVMDAMEQSYAL